MTPETMAVQNFGHVCTIRIDTDLAQKEEGLVTRLVCRSS
jgi:hypothetical protein